MISADAGYAGKPEQTRRELFLVEMDQVVPWKGLAALIEPHYFKGEGGRPGYPLITMLRVYLMPIRRLEPGAYSGRNDHPQFPSIAGEE